MFSLDEFKLKIVSETVPIDHSQVDSNSRPGLIPKNLVILCSAGPSLWSAVAQRLAYATSVHLVIERDGSAVAQMVDFDRRVFHTNEFDQSALAIELVYPSYLLESPGYWNSRARYDPLEMIYALSLNDRRWRWWPLHSQEQLDTLLEITRLLDREFKLERILVKHEINKSYLNSGPAFPINRLRQLVEGEDAATDLYEETATEAVLFLQPDENGERLLEQPLPPNTPIAVTYETEDAKWVLVEVMAALDGRRWTVGWMQADKVQAKPFIPHIDEEHMLVTSDNRRIRYIAANDGNFNADGDLDPRFVVIHFTTGTNPLSTVHTFMNPEEGVSTHLLVARNGRVVQFVPFDKIAYHCGHSAWEGRRHLNSYAIGIEVDNAGQLIDTKDGHKRKGVHIPIDQVSSKRHWKDSFERSWQTFTDTQVAVVCEIVKALKAKYQTIEEIVGHDMVNIMNRYDPGPFYPLGELREAVLGNPQQAIKHYVTTEECPIYENVEFRPPNVPNPEYGELPMNSRVRVKTPGEKWSVVIVKRSKNKKLKEKQGWVLSDSIEPARDNGKNHLSRTKISQTLYKVVPAAIARLPGIELKTGRLSCGTHVRIQYSVGDEWALVAPVLEVRKDADGKYEIVVPEDKVKRNFLEGWVKCEYLKKFTPEEDPCVALEEEPVV